jgi:hypothetical protein
MKTETPIAEPLQTDRWPSKLQQPGKKIIGWIWLLPGDRRAAVIYYKRDHGPRVILSTLAHRHDDEAYPVAPLSIETRAATLAAFSDTKRESAIEAAELLELQRSEEGRRNEDSRKAIPIGRR